MRKALLLSLFISGSLSASFAQENSDRSHNNEFGVDATGFIRQFLNFNSSTGQSTIYEPIYYLTYRRHFPIGNIRFAIGGNFANNEYTSNSLPVDTLIYHSNSSSVNARIGWEFTSEISKRWQVFYGVDFRPSYVYFLNEGNYSTSGINRYVAKTETKRQVYGGAPLLGFRYRITQRLSVVTEASFSVNRQISETKTTYVGRTSATPFKADDKFPKLKTAYTQFTQPISLFLTVDL